MALCDVDQQQLAAPAKLLPAARTHSDFRRMFDAMERQIDAVVIATPVHAHAVIAAAALKRRKHVYLEKPLTQDVGEARELRAMARRYKVATQLGNQGVGHRFLPPHAGIDPGRGHRHAARGARAVQ